MNITGNRLRLLRQEKDMSQEEVAKKIGISRTGYNKYESGDIKPVRKIKELSALFGVSADYILGLDEPPLAEDTEGEELYRKYVSLSDRSKEMVKLLINALYERELQKFP